MKWVCGNKMPTRCNRDFYCRSYCCSILQTGHITLSSTPDQQLENHSTKYHRHQPLYNTLELLMMGIVVPETCWGSNKICNKNLYCIYLAFYFHILTTMHGQNHIKYEVSVGEIGCENVDSIHVPQEGVQCCSELPKSIRHTKFMIFWGMILLRRVPYFILVRSGPVQTPLSCLWSLSTAQARLDPPSLA